MSRMIDLFKAARRAGTPLIAIKTSDPERTMLSLQAFNKTTPVISWDCVRGWESRNGKPGQDAIDKAVESSGNPIEATVNYSTHLEMALHLPFDSQATQPTNPLLFVLNGHKYFDEKEFVQALWNLREPFKESFRSVVLLGPSFDLPAELQHDILVLDEPLPNDMELREIVIQGGKNIDTVLKDEVVEAAVDALRGLGAFESEQAVSMCLTRNDLNIENLWERKRQMINQTPGLSVWRGGQKFEDIGGLDEIKHRFQRIIRGKACPKLVVWMDEIEKMSAGSGSDSSGTSQDQQGVLLSDMQDNNWTGAMFIGVPGAAKSVLAKAIANQIGVLTLKLDLGGLKAKYVGDSEERIRNAMKVIKAVAGDGGAFFIATSNDIRAITPELKRRFKKGIWFFPLPTQTERAVIWSIYLKKYGWSDAEAAGERFSVMPFQDKWTGAEIESCVQTSWEEDITIDEAARSIIPVAVSGKEQVERLYQESHNRYNSVSYPGVFDKNKEMAVEVPKAGGRKIAQEEEEVLQA